MANTTLTPNMSLVVPTVSTDPGPDWANNVNASLSIIDGHNHSSGSGAPISVDGLSITTDLPFNGNSATELKSAQFQDQGAVLPGATIDALYVVGGELFYNDAIGNQVQITLSGSVTGASGTITGLPSGTASVSYNSGTFSFKSATNTPASMSVGPIVTGANSVNPKFVTISASGAQPNDYSLIWPLALPTTGTRFVTSTTGGQLDYGSTVPSAPAVQSLLAMGATGIISTPFKYLTASGSLAAFGSLTLLAAASYTQILGVVGMTSDSGGGTPWAGLMMPGAVRVKIATSATGAVSVDSQGSTTEYYSVLIIYT